MISYRSSSLRPATSGAPQGSIRRPIPFNVFVNGLDGGTGPFSVSSELIQKWEGWLIELDVEGMCCPFDTSVKAGELGRKVSHEVQQKEIGSSPFEEE